MTTQDPRAAGFNYGAPIPEPFGDALYEFCKIVAEVYRKRISRTAQERSWHLDQLIRDVRHSCTLDEQLKHRTYLKEAIGPLSSYLHPKQHAKLYNQAIANTWAQLNTWKPNNIG